MKKFFGLFLLFITVVALVGGSRWLRLNDSNAVSASDPTSIYLKNGANLQKLSDILVDSAGVIDDKEELFWAGTLLGWRKFQPGHYRVDSAYTYEAFLSKLAKGIQDPVNITIVPGQNKKSLINFLANSMQLDSSAILNVLSDSAYLSKKNITPKSLIGHFFPATYDLYWTSSAKVILNRIFTEFERQVMQPHQNRIRELDLTLDEVLALASIIEWEAAQNDEMPKISGLYWNRLNRGMRLQADPTVNFIVDERRRLYYKDYKIDHPYNTYVHRGLPPGPITNPSLNSIKAALYPAEHDYLFMVAKPNGSHAFTETFSEHERKSAEWRKYIQEQQRIKEARQAKKDSADQF